MQAEFSIKVPINIKKKTDIYVSHCPVFDLYSQGESKKEAMDNIIEAITLFVVTCFEQGTLDIVLKECGFKPIRTARKSISHNPAQNYVTVPIPFEISEISSHSKVCHA